jgi:hypothetical protein
VRRKNSSLLQFLEIMQKTESHMKNGQGNALKEKFGMKSNLRVIGAFAVLGMMALAVSCKGFFQPPTWTAITIQPPNPSVAVGYSTTLQAFGTDTNGNHSQITSGLVWDLSNATGSGTVATLNPNSGEFTGVSPGTVTITASSEGVSGTATGTVAEQVTTMTITPSSTSVVDDGTSFATFTVTSGGTNISSLVTLTAYQSGQAVTDITCSYDSTDNGQDCTPASGLVPSGSPSQVYSIVVTYAGYIGTAQVSATLTVSAP